MIPALRLRIGGLGHWLLLLLCLSLAGQALAAPPRAELLPGASDGDWLLIIEADGQLRGDELSLTPLLRQFAVGRVTLSRVTTEVRSLTRWQIPLHRVASDARQVPTLALGTQWTPSLPLPERNEPQASAGAANGAAPLSPIELQASVLHQGPLYPGQPFLYQLSLWLPANLEAPNLSEPAGNGFTIRRLGDDRWESPASPGMPGRLTRRWLLQAKEPGFHPLESPRFQGRLPQEGGQSEALSARAATQFIKVDKAPVEPVASRLILRQQLSPATGARVGEPVIRTLTLVMEGGDGNRLPRLPQSRLPAGLLARPDGEQQEERFVAKGALRFERQWRQALSAEAPGRYPLPAVDLPWFNTRNGRIEHARLPAQTLIFEAAIPSSEQAPAPVGESLNWVLVALLLRTLWRGGPRWLAFYRLQLALAAGEPDSARWALLAWADLRWTGAHQHLASLPCHGDPAIGALLDNLDRACFDSSSPANAEVDWRRLAKALCAFDTVAVASGLSMLAWLRH
ncbi:BatD family protein [Aeromonas aquatica]|uniref:BatD family protein n=1 Tax=Aeromonas aquatica TaxID=558964 RepID=UPI0009DCE6D5